MREEPLGFRQLKAFYNAEFACLPEAGIADFEFNSETRNL